MPDPPNLKSLQEWMQKSLVFPRLTDEAHTADTIRSSSRLSSQEKLGIYQRSYYLRLLKCMDEQFPVLRQALGEELFKDFACEYLKDFPSKSYTLYNLGQRFPRYLAETRPDRELPPEQREQWIDFMIDLAQWELDLFMMYDAPGHEGKQFASPETPDERLALQPCFSLHHYQFPVSWYYYATREKEDPAIPSAEKSWIVLLRRDFLTRIYPVPKISYSFLEKISQGKIISEALQEIVNEFHSDGEIFSQQWNAPNGTKEVWIQSGFLVDRNDPS